MNTITIRTKYLFFLLLSLGFLLVIYDFNGDGKFFCEPNSHNPFMIQPMESIWNSIRSDLVLDHQVESARVKKEIAVLLADKEKLYKILSSAAPYIYFIHKITKEQHLPAEVALIPVIESEFNPNDHSKKGATGLWQLMPATAKGLGVKVKANYDGRRNIVSSTKAALAYLMDLRDYFNGNWYLAISAYNCGQGLIDSAVRRTGSHDFWNLRLPAETKVYLPKLLAVAAIIKDPDKYGVQLPPIKNKPFFAEIKTTKPINLTKIAKTTGANIKTLHALNPDYRHDSAAVPNKQGAYTVLVPVKDAPVVEKKLPAAIVTSK
jgi:membrane-bound lytic murein transglycosylase D